MSKPIVECLSPVYNVGTCFNPKVIPANPAPAHRQNATSQMATGMMRIFRCTGLENRLLQVKRWLRC